MISSSTFDRSRPPHNRPPSRTPQSTTQTPVSMGVRTPQSTIQTPVSMGSRTPQSTTQTPVSMGVRTPQSTIQTPVSMGRRTPQSTIQTPVSVGVRTPKSTTRTPVSIRPQSIQTTPKSTIQTQVSMGSRTQSSSTYSNPAASMSLLKLLNSPKHKSYTDQATSQSGHTLYNRYTPSNIMPVSRWKTVYEIAGNEYLTGVVAQFMESTAHFNFADKVRPTDAGPEWPMRVYCAERTYSWRGVHWATIAKDFTALQVTYRGDEISINLSHCTPMLLSEKWIRRAMDRDNLAGIIPDNKQLKITQFDGNRVYIELTRENYGLVAKDKNPNSSGMWPVAELFYTLDDDYHFSLVLHYTRTRD
eukprot:632548_1